MRSVTLLAAVLGCVTSLSLSEAMPLSARKRQLLSLGDARYASAAKARRTVDGGLGQQHGDASESCTVQDAEQMEAEPASMASDVCVVETSIEAALADGCL